MHPVFYDCKYTMPWLCMYQAKKASNLILTDFHRAISECEHSLGAAVVPYFLSRAVKCEHLQCWAIRRQTLDSGEFEWRVWSEQNPIKFLVHRIVLWRKCGARNLNIQGNSLCCVNMLPICILEILQGLAPFISAWILQNLYKLWKIQSTVDIPEL